MGSELFEFNFNSNIILPSKYHWHFISYITKYIILLYVNNRSNII